MGGGTCTEGREWAGVPVRKEGNGWGYLYGRKGVDMGTCTEGREWVWVPVQKGVGVATCTEGREWVWVPVRKGVSVATCTEGREWVWVPVWKEGNGVRVPVQKHCHGNRERVLLFFILRKKNQDNVINCDAGWGLRTRLLSTKVRQQTRVLYEEFTMKKILYVFPFSQSGQGQGMVVFMHHTPNYKE